MKILYLALLLILPSYVFGEPNDEVAPSRNKPLATSPQTDEKPNIVNNISIGSDSDLLAKFQKLNEVGVASNIGPKKRNPAEFLILLAPAVSFLFVLTNRQARVSTIARENCTQIHEESTKPFRRQSLRRQNCLLYQRYIVIKIAQFMLCVGLLVIGYYAWDEYFHDNNPELFAVGLFTMGGGTLIIAYELLRGADTLSNEIEIADWDGTGTPPIFVRFALFRKPWFRRVHCQNQKAESGSQAHH